MKCPECGKRLELIKLKADTWYGHAYNLAHILKDKPLCDYSQNVK